MLKTALANTLKRYWGLIATIAAQDALNDLEARSKPAGWAGPPRHPVPTVACGPSTLRKRRK
jgi:hypothetical protein